MRRFDGLDVIEVDPLLKGYVAMLVDDGGDPFNMRKFRLVLVNGTTGVSENVYQGGTDFKLFSNILTTGQPSSVSSLGNGNALLFLTNEAAPSGFNPVVVLGN